MADTVIRVENLSKRYILNHQQEGQGKYKTLQDTIVDGAKSLVSTIQNPLASRRKALSKIQNSSREEFWAVKDVSFEIKQGDRVGIIGRNGAGKSTLLKLLSRIVEPTHGQIEITGRVASLLEVGTGFHPELTGRENIYLNGAILGMGREEIKRKFDEIVAFAEVEKFLDTPVKRYSSGMYVRLAFAVAAHLEPEILIVDEVLAVGDAQFQEKCLGKMQSVAADGRTVLFVSHNINAIQRLCSSCIMLENGQISKAGKTDQVLVHYIKSGSISTFPDEWINVSQVQRSAGNGKVRFMFVKYSSFNEKVGNHPYSEGLLDVKLNINSDSFRTLHSISVILYDEYGTKLVNADSVSLGQSIALQKGMNLVQLRIDSLYLNAGNYVLGLWAANPSEHQIFDFIEQAFKIEVVSLKSQEVGIKPPADGAVTCNFNLRTLSNEISIGENSL